MNMYNRLVITRGESGGAKRKVDGIKGVKYVVTERNLTMSDEQCNIHMPYC